MKLKLNDIICGFRVTAVRPSAELGGTMYQMEHEKTGAQLIWMDSGVSNKLFSIAFKTIPEDSTGVFHILEHSVLGGSKKYPVKEPFVDLLKSSMNTFLNAMTFPDKTMYPVSSRNRQDFLNLTSVYLDAVFAPRTLETQDIFHQEGWHIEQDENGRLSYKGVVFNEMKGAMSDKEEMIRQRLQEMVFPDTCYAYNSGGEPTVIPTLTYENYIASYKKYYHPTNSRIFLDGDVPLEDTLALIDSYLKDYDRLEGLPDVTLQQPVKAQAENEYELPQSESPENKTYVSFSKIIGSWEDRAKLIAADVLCSALGSFNEAPITKAVLEPGLAEDFEMYADGGIAQSVFTFIAKNVKDGREQELLDAIRAAAKEQAEGGLDHGLIEAYINRLEFKTRENEEPQGLRRAIGSMSGWLYGGDPMLYLENDKVFADLRRMLEEGYFEKLLYEMLLDDSTGALLFSRPSHSLGDELRKAEEAKLEAIAKSWTEKDYEENRIMNSQLTAWQQSEDTPEQSATIPVVELSEVSEEPDYPVTEKKEQQGVTVLYHPLPTNGIAHINLYFNLSGRSLEELEKISFLGSILGELPTENYSVSELEKEIKKYLGRMEMKLAVSSKKGETESCTPMMAVRISLLKENLPHAARLLEEILFRSDFSRLDSIRDIMIQESNDAKEAPVGAGHALAASIAGSGYSAENAVLSATSGYGHISWLSDFADNIDDRLEAFAAFLKDAISGVFCSKALTASLACTEELDLAQLISIFPEGVKPAESSCYKAELPKKSAYEIPAQIGFSAQAAVLSGLGEEYSGSMNVASQILTYGYLWNMVRVQGGAYGTGLRTGIKGSIYSYSFRDPSPAKSLEINKGLGSYLRGIASSGEPLDKFIISTIAATEPLRGVRAEAVLADSDWFAGLSREDIKRQRTEILRTSPSDLNKCADILDKFAENAAVCLVANKALIENSPELTVLK